MIAFGSTRRRTSMSASTASSAAHPVIAATSSGVRCPVTVAVTRTTMVEVAMAATDATRCADHARASSATRVGALDNRGPDELLPERASLGARHRAGDAEFALERLRQHLVDLVHPAGIAERPPAAHQSRSEEHTSELQSLMRISYAVFCLKKKKTHKKSLN